MARATYIYTVHNLQGGFVGAWTVKHELVSRLWRGEIPPAEVYVQRCMDAHPEERLTDLGTGTEFLERERGNRDAR